ncbi:hypothetical protein Bca4012_024748 [Brassica carinata]
MEGSKKMMKRPMKDVYGSDAAEGFNKGKEETVASSTVNSLAAQIELLDAIEGKFDLVAELEKLTLKHAEAETILGDVKVKVPDWDKLGEEWLFGEEWLLNE